jgi:3-hydroxyisobutyrate dehydrogenase-like beta-hydroxyacid dehydrogenase
MARSKSKNVGVIGLGIIGSRVAGALRAKGLQVFVWNRTPRPEQNFVGSPAEVAELCDVVQIFVSDDEALLEMTRQLTPTLTAQHVVTAHSTVAPESMRAAAEIVQRRGARFLDAPFTGSKGAAEKGQLVYYIAGDEAALKQIRPILAASSKEILIISDRIGDASIMKVATNIVTAATAQVAAEALALLRKSGIDPEVFQRAMKHNASNSTTLEMKVPMMISGDFEPHFSVKHMLKDVRIGLKLAESHLLSLPVTDVSGDMLLAEMKKGRGDADYASIAQRYFPSGKPFVRQEAPKATEPPKAEAPKTEPPKVEPVSVAKEAAPASAPTSATKESPGESPNEKQEKSEAKEEEPLPGENLSGGIRGWLSRLGSSSRRSS